MVSEPWSTMATTPQNSITSSHHTFSIKLTSKNYLTWKTQFVPMLNYQNLKGYVDGTLPEPPKTISDPTKPNEILPNLEYQTWFQ
jgi:hypothetical protein